MPTGFDKIETRRNRLMARNTPAREIMRCAECKVMHTPLWRKGPSGKKELCNAWVAKFADP